MDAPTDVIPPLDTDSTLPPQDDAPDIDPAEADTAANKERHEKLLSLAKERFQQALDAHKDDFEQCAKVQDFIAGDQWPASIKADREANDRPCLTLDHLNQNLRHVVNGGLMRSREIRCLAMSGESSDDVATMLAGLVRQITQTSTSSIAYETGLRHACSVGFGYWRVKVQKIPRTALQEIVIRKIKEPRMVLLDPFCDYPDARDATYGFVLTKLTKKDFESQYPKASAEGVQSWHLVNKDAVLPWITGDVVVVAEYYYLDGETMRWAILTPNEVLAEGVHHGDVLPIIRVIGDEFEQGGKERRRGMFTDSALDAQRVYNYSASAFTETVALAPLSPWVVAAGQIEKYVSEWKDAHRTPRAALRYDPVTIAGQLAPPPQRAQAADIPQGWQGMMQNIIQDMQMILGLAQPNVLGTGGIPVQSGAGIDAQKEPGDVNTNHFVEHWHSAIEQTGRVILAMIPTVYTEPQAVKIIGEDGMLETALLNPQQEQPMMEQKGPGANGLEKVLSTSYNPMIGRYDVAISTGPASATKKSEANRMMMGMVQADPTIMQKAGDLVVATLDMAGADTLAKRLKAFLPPGVAEDDEAQLLQTVQQLQQQNQQLTQQAQELQQIVMGAREQAQASLVEAQMQHQADLLQEKQKSATALLEQRMNDESTLRLAMMKGQLELELMAQQNIVKILIAKMQATNKLDIEAAKHLSAVSLEHSHDERMHGYAQVLGELNDVHESPPMPNGEPTSLPMA